MHDIFDLFRTYNILSPEILLLVRNYCQKWQVSGYHGLLETNLLSDSEMADKLAYYMKMDRIYSILPGDDCDAAFQFIPYDIARGWECFPIVIKYPKPIYEVVLADPTQRERVEWLRNRAKNQLILAVGERRDILRAIREFYPISDQLPNLR